ncbi:MAG: zinc ribbon domain-containing protein [Planctomycetes bacterium]|nr:zinc ribbon domain-containing protein [Planctomycetota bacterium]
MADEPAADGADTIECPECAELVKARAKTCKHCGHDLAGRGKKTRRREGRQSPRGTTPRHIVVRGVRSGGLAAVLSFFLPGLGHLYAGSIFFGLCTMVGTFLMVPLAMMVLVVGNAADLLPVLYVGVAIGWIAQIYMAYAAAEGADRRAR